MSNRGQTEPWSILRLDCLAIFIVLVLAATAGVAATPFDDDAVRVPAGIATGAGAAPASLSTALARAGIPIRIAGYNIAHARGNDRGGLKELARKKNLEGIAKLLAGEKIDIVGLTEISKGDLRAGFRDQTEFLAKKLGFKYHVYGENVSKGWGGILATQGNAVVSRWPIRSWRNHKLWRADEKSEQRSCVEALIEVARGRNLRVLVCHLSLDKTESRRQVEQIWALVEKSAEPVVLVGDFNLRPQHETVKWLSTRMRDTTRNLDTTFMNKPGVKIDYHFITEPLLAGCARVLGFTEGYSDHGCVINDYFWPLSGR